MIFSWWIPWWKNYSCDAIRAKSVHNLSLMEMHPHCMQRLYNLTIFVTRFVHQRVLSISTVKSIHRLETTSIDSERYRQFITRRYTIRICNIFLHRYFKSIHCYWNICTYIPTVKKKVFHILTFLPYSCSPQSKSIYIWYTADLIQIYTCRVR